MALLRRFDLVMEPILPDEYYQIDEKSVWKRKGKVSTMGFPGLDKIKFKVTHKSG